MTDAIPLIVNYAPDRPFAWRNGQALSCESAWSAMQALAASLPPRSACLNLCDDRYRFTLAFGATLLCGGVNLLPQSRAAGAIDKLRVDHPGCVQLDDKAVDQCLAGTINRTGATPPDLPYEQVAAIAFTSGSTGVPQPHPKRWGDLYRSTQMAEKRLFQGEEPVNIAATVPPQHMYGLETSILTVLLGGDAAHSDCPLFPWAVRDALDAMPEPRLLVTTPMHLQSLLRAGSSMPRLQGVISATAPLEAALAERCERQWNTTVREIYGCTETGSLASRRTMAEESWQLYDEVTIQADGEHALLRGPQLPETVRLDDRIEVLSKQRFRLLGRSGAMIKVAGKRLSLSELNSQLLAIDGVDDAAILPPDDAAGRMRPAAAVVAPLISERAIAAKLVEQIDPAFVPRPLVRVDAIPRNAVGKLPRSTLAALINGRHSGTLRT